MTDAFANYSITRAEIVTAAQSLLGFDFRHQARGENNSVDCVGALVVMGQRINYPLIFDLLDYRRVPSAFKIREMLDANMDAIPVDEVRAGDVYLCRVGGVKPRHVTIRVSDETNIERGIVPMMIHAKAIGGKGKVVCEPVSSFPRSWYVQGFRVRGLNG